MYSAWQSLYRKDITKQRDFKGGEKLLYAKIESLCREKGVSIAKVEKECNIGNATIRRWDKSFPRIDTLKKVADFFGKPIEYFLE